MILGVSGLNGAGKGEVVRYLEARSFYALSLSDVIRDELRERGLEESRERMIEAGNAIRAAERSPKPGKRQSSSIKPPSGPLVFLAMV